jgi:hypothetical protein
MHFSREDLARLADDLFSFALGSVAPFNWLGVVHSRTDRWTACGDS